MLDDRTSQMIGLDDDEFLDSTLGNKEGLKSAQYSNMSAISSATRGDERHRSDLRKIEKEKREKNQVNLISLSFSYPDSTYNFFHHSC